jgi:tRNA nucleotidyltransferase (CCA-adding enzyme)
MLTDNESVQGLLRQSDPDMDIDEALARRDFTMNAMA